MRRIYLESLFGLVLCFILGVVANETIVYDLNTDYEYVLEDNQASAHQELMALIAENQGLDAAHKAMKQYVDTSLQKLTIYNHADMIPKTVSDYFNTHPDSLIFHDKERDLWFRLAGSDNTYYYAANNDTLVRQKVDLEEISITKLADQFHQYLTEKENLNLEIASEYLLMATWLTYLKSKLLLPETDEEVFQAFEVAEKLKLQLKKLELIRLLSSQMLDRKRLGRDVFMRGSKSGVKSIYDKKVSLTLFELLKAYSGIVMTKDFHTMNIPKLPVFTTEDAIKRIKEFFGTLNDWKNLSELVPSGFNKSPNLKRTGKAGIFAGSLELVKEGNISLKQKELFDDIYVKEN